MSFTLTLDGADVVIGRLNRLADRDLTEAAAAGVAETVIHAHGEIVAELSKPGTGRLYSRRGRKHRASAPGQPPAVDTGTYRSSIHFDLPGAAGATDAAPEGTVHTNDRRAPWLEYGTRRMAPRPHFGPVAERLEAEGTLAENVARHVEAALQRASGGT